MRHLLQYSKTSSPVFQVGQPITCVTPSADPPRSHAFQMWLQAIAIILPRVRDQYGVSNNVIGALSSSTFAGMFLGAFVWGTCMHFENRPVPLHAFILMAYSSSSPGSDVLGRAMAFNLTLILTSIIGATAMLAQSYIQLCVVMFFLGTAVGVRFQPTQRISIYLTHSHSW